MRIKVIIGGGGGYLNAFTVLEPSGYVVSM